MLRKEKNPIKQLQKRAYHFLKEFPSYKGILSMARAALGSNNKQLAQKARDIIILMTKPAVNEFRWEMDSGLIECDFLTVFAPDKCMKID